MTSEAGLSARAPLAQAWQPWVEQAALVIIPSYRCNLRCRHCYARGSTTAELSAHQFLDLVRTGGRLGFHSIEISGGEFFSWAHAGEVAPALVNSNVPVTIVTNGTLLTESLVQALAGSRVRLCISVDGPEEVHDWLRGAGAFLHASRVAELCKRHGVPFVIASTVLRRSLRHVGATAARALAWGAEGVYFGPLQDLGGASTALADERLGDEQCVDLIAHVSLLHAKTAPDLPVQVINLGVRATAAAHPCAAHACWGASCKSDKYWPSVVAVRPDGVVLPQSLHIGTGYALGDVSNGGLEPLVRSYWGSERHREFQYLTRFVFRDIILSSSAWFYAWDELIRRASALPPRNVPRYLDVPHPYDHSTELLQLRRVSRSIKRRS